MKLIKKILLILGGILLIHILIYLIFGFTLMYQWGFIEGLIEGFFISYLLELIILILIVLLIKNFKRKKKK